MTADVQRPGGGRMTAGLRPQQQPGQLGSFKSRPGRGPAPGRDGWCCQEAGQPGSWPTSASRSQPIGARRAQDILKTHPCWSGRGAGMCQCLPWHLHSWGLSTGQAFPHQRRPLSRKSQRFSSINTSVGGELWGPQEPQGGLFPSKSNPGAGISCERPEEDAGGPQIDPF